MAAALLIACLTLAAAQAVRAAHRPRVSVPRVSAFWYRVAVCETGYLGKPRWNWGAEHRPSEGHRYEGGLGFAATTWTDWARHLGLLGRYPHAYMAPPVVQARVAAYGLSVGGYWGSLHNGCAG